MDVNPDGILFRATVSLADVRRGDEVRIPVEDLTDPWIAGQIRKRNLVQLEPIPELPDESESEPAEPPEGDDVP